MSQGKKLMLSAALAAAVVGAEAKEAAAFCGFYVNGAGGEMFNDATQVVLMRMGTRTVLSMQNNYQGPPEAFALVIPVPTVLQEGDVKTLPAEVFGKVDAMGSPRLVEYWEQDPCQPDVEYEKDMVRPSSAPAGMVREDAKAEGDLGVTVEAQFVVGEYQIVILSALDATGLETWLTREKYAIPKGAEPLLRPYVEGGSKFFVAKVDPTKVTFKDGRAALSPLRFHYDAEALALPIRLGLANSSGTQDLIVSILSPEGRYGVSNYGNVTIPTNLDVRDEVRNRFGEFYAALFDRTLEKHPGSVVTEYAWDATSCDPCPGPQLDYHDLTTLGGDVLGGGPGKVEPYQNWQMTLTRLHARYSAADAKDDLLFTQVKPIVGGREFLQAGGKLEEGAREDRTNNFQGRYAIRHEWTGPVECKDPRRGVWGGPPRGEPSVGVQAGRDLAFAPRGQVQLAQLVAEDVPELDLKAAGAGAPPVSGDPAKVDPATTANAGAGGDKPADKPAEKKKGCGCAAGGDGAPAGTLLLLGVVGALVHRRRRSRV